MSITKQGIFKIGSLFNTLTFDTTIYTESDGSKWIRIFHHNNPSVRRFASSDDFVNGVKKSDDLWFNVGICSAFSTQWELMYKQKLTSSAGETTYRFIQYTNPMTAKYQDVSPGNTTAITGGQSNRGGIYHFDNSGGVIYGGSYLVVANDTQGNWFGATGCSYLYEGGMPGLPNTVITTGYLDLYLRVDNSNATLANPEYRMANAKIGKSGYAGANIFYEI